MLSFKTIEIEKKRKNRKQSQKHLALLTEDGFKEPLQSK